MDFFKHGSLLKQLKATFLVLVSTPDKFRPISLTNELYKIISHILLYRIEPIIAKLIGPMQTAFILGRTIADNILLA